MSETIFVKEEIGKLKGEIDMLRKEIETKEAILSFLESRIVKNNTSVQTENKQVQIDFDDLVVANRSSGKPTITDEIRGVVSDYFTGKEFTVAHCEAALLKLGKVEQSKNLRTRIATVLGRMQEDGELIRTFEGKGNVPHRYRVHEEQESVEDVLDLA